MWRNVGMFLLNLIPGFGFFYYQKMSNLAKEQVGIAKDLQDTIKTTPPMYLQISPQDQTDQRYLGYMADLCESEYFNFYLASLEYSFLNLLTDANTNNSIIMEQIGALKALKGLREGLLQLKLKYQGELNG